MRVPIGVLRVLAVLAVVSLAGTARGAADARDEVLEAYLGLVERYRSGAREDAIRELATWGPAWIEWGVDGLLSQCEWAEDGRIVHPSGRAARILPFVRTAQAAFLLHVDTTLDGFWRGSRPPEHERHMEAALHLLRWFRDQWPQPEEAKGLSPRDFYLALAAVELKVARPRKAARLAWESLGRDPRDAEMRLLAGCAEETASLVYRQSDDDREAEKALLRAADWFRDALEEDPELAEARLRLGWVRLQQRWPDKARRLLEEVAQTPGDDRRRSLAWLFLGEAHDREGRPEEAIVAYRQAVDLAPHGQAARVALALALERHSGDDDARAVLRQFFLREVRSRRASDPWADYPFGPPELGLRPFETLCERLLPR